MRSGDEGREAAAGSAGGAGSGGAVALSALLREGTAEAHRQAERAPFLGALLRGALSREAYARYLASLHPVYVALEGALEAHRAHPHLAPFARAELYRTEALAADLAHLAGPDWRTGVAVARAGEAYAEHVAGLAAREPLLLVAHAYTRYLGDLSGGQLLRKPVARAYGLTGPEGLAFYAFPRVADVRGCARDFRAALDALDLPPPRAGALLAEARHAFALNGALFAELAPAGA
jgi:heme oxygenase